MVMYLDSLGTMALQHLCTAPLGQVETLFWAHDRLDGTWPHLACSITAPTRSEEQDYDSMRLGLVAASERLSVVHEDGRRQPGWKKDSAERERYKGLCQILLGS